MLDQDQIPVRVMDDFTDYNPNPIIQYNMTDQKLQYNLAARSQFPSVIKQGPSHPLLNGLLESITNFMHENSNFIVFVREIEFAKRIYEQQIFSIPQKKSIYIYMTDITERKQAETQITEFNKVKEQDVLERTHKLENDIKHSKEIQTILQKSKDRVELSLRLAKVATWSWDVLRDIVIWDDLMYELFGIEKSKPITSFSTISEMIHPDDKGNFLHGFEQCWQNKTFYDTNFKVLHPDGSVKYLNLRGNATFDNFDQPIRMAGICLDISHQKN